MNTWILVCDASRARIFRRDQPGRAWTLEKSLEHPNSRLMESELVEGQRGRTQQSFGQGARSAMEPNTQPKEAEHEVFAAELSRFLEHGFDLNSYSELVLVAPPHFLGLLRKSMTAKLGKRVIGSFDKDFSQMQPHEVEPRVEQLLAAAPHSTAERPSA